MLGTPLAKQHQSQRASRASTVAQHVKEHEDLTPEGSPQVHMEERTDPHMHAGTLAAAVLPTGPIKKCFKKCLKSASSLWIIVIEIIY